MGVYLRGKSWYIDFHYEGKRITERVGRVSKSVAEEKLNIRRSEVIRGEWKPMENISSATGIIIYIVRMNSPIWP